MAEIIKKEELSKYVSNTVFKFENAGKDDIVVFEFDFLQSEDVIDYVEPGCGCTKAWVENGKIVGNLTISKVGGLNPKGTTSINKVVTIMLDPGQRYLIPGPKKEKTINDKKRWFRLTLAGTAVVE